MHVVVSKHKIPIVSNECKFEMAMIPHSGLEAGGVDSWNTLFAYMKACKFVTETDKKKWQLADPDGELVVDLFDTQKALRSAVESNPDMVAGWKKAIITMELNRVYCGLKVIGG